MQGHMIKKNALVVAVSASLLGAAYAGPFNSGSTGAMGAFNPTANTEVDLPPDGVLHYTTVNIPAGVTVKFKKNAANTAVVMLTTGDVLIAGTIDIRGGNSATTKYGMAADMNKGGIGGPGGFDGGRGGLQEQNRKGGAGFGPGGGGGGSGAGAVAGSCGDITEGAGGGGFAGAGEASWCVRYAGYDANIRAGFAGPAYGYNSMLPLVGGSGGGGGSGGLGAGGLPGSGGGGGGGALMLVASGSVTLTGAINAAGGAAGNINNGDCNQSLKDSGGPGGGGAGGAVRILAPSFSGTGSINVNGGAGGCRVGGTSLNNANSAGYGGIGRSSIEIVTGGAFNFTTLPSLKITSIGGVVVPANPTGAGDVSLDAGLANPVAVEVAASNIPVGSIVKLTLNQPYGPSKSVNTSALAGTLAASTAAGNIEIPAGSSVISASVTYSLTVAMGEALKVYAQGERVEKVHLVAVLGGEMEASLITVSGKEYRVPASVLAVLPV